MSRRSSCIAKREGFTFWARPGAELVEYFREVFLLLEGEGVSNAILQFEDFAVIISAPFSLRATIQDFLHTARPFF
jgi:hypothetical protein